MCFECTPIRNLCTESRLFNHRAKFHRGPNSGFKCHLCNQKFLTPRKLRKHKKMSHVFTKTYPCHFCDELFTSETGVTTHERIHTGIIKFECKICDYKCNRFNVMEEHKKEEHGYVCAVCNEKQSEWADIKNHTLTTHGGYLSMNNTSGKFRLELQYLVVDGSKEFHWFGFSVCDFVIKLVISPHSKWRDGYLVCPRFENRLITRTF